MRSDVRNMLILGVASFAGARAGRRLTPRLAAALGVTVGPWGLMAGAFVGGMLGAWLVGKVAGPRSATAPGDHI